MRNSLNILFIAFLVFYQFSHSQNLVQDGAISNSNANWNGQESPWNASTYQSSYMAACGTNYVMELDAASMPTQTLTGFVNSLQYVLSFRYAYRTAGCGPSNNPTFLRISFTDALGVLDYTLSIPNTQSTFADFSYTFTNNGSTSHTLQFANPGNVNTCGVIVDDISLMKLSAPGGIAGANLSYWLKSESIALPDNSNVYAWISQGNNVVSITSPCGNPPNFKTGLASAANQLVANFNPYITFNGTNQYLSYETNRINMLDVSAGGAGGSIFTVFQGGNKGRSYFGHRSLTTNSRIDGKTDSLMIVDGTTTGASNTMRYNHNGRVNICAIKGKTGGLTLNDLNGGTQTLVDNAISNDYLSVGVRKNNGGTYERFFDGSVSEMMIFNTILSNTQMHQVRSYLGTKYGVTLSDNSLSIGIDERTYLASDGTTVYWDYVANSAFHNNVTIIGRDDATGLNQQKSISTDADAGSNTGNAMLIIDNSAAISSNNSFLSTGHNGTVIPNPGGADFIDVPAGIQSRLKRVWKFQKTGVGIANNIFVSFDMTGFSPLTGSDLRLVVSNSTVFSGASVIAGAYAAPYFTASLPTTGGVYFTVASTNSVTTPLPITLLSFSAKLIQEFVEIKWKTATELNSKAFDVERSIDGINFEKINSSLSKAPNGNSNSELNYLIVDNSVTVGTRYYYRLKHSNLDESYTYSEIISIDIKNRINDKDLFNILPNPSQGNFTLNFTTSLQKNCEIKITIVNSIGKLIYSSIISENQLDNNKFYPKNECLANGTYIITCEIEGKTTRVLHVVVR
jgi:hypothetical protein